MFSKTCIFPYFYNVSHLFCLWNNFPPPPHLPLFFFIESPPSQPRFHKPYPQSKTFLNKLSVHRSAVFGSNGVFIRTPSSSMHFFSFFDVLPSATGMTLMLLMFHIFFISVFSFWYLSTFFSFFTGSYVSKYSNMNHDTTSFILIHCNSI